jgi:glucose-6-phosphate isomerase
LTIDIAATEEWTRLLSLHARAPRIREQFARDPERARRFSVEAAGLFVDFSKNRIDDGVLRELIALAHRAGLDQARARMFAGEPVNATEDRAALHVALRDRSSRTYSARGAEISSLVRAELAKMERFCAHVHSDARGFRGDPLDTVVHIGIGGSDLGPRMAVDALKQYWLAGQRTLFVSNVDGRHLGDALASVDPARTLFIVASKTFSTLETVTNARAARDALIGRGASDRDVARQFAALTSNSRAAAEFGVAPDQVFSFWDWVGGRFSLWSVIGLPVALQIGFDVFAALQGGAAAMDRHFETAPAGANAPVLLALIGLWNRNFEGAAAHAILPYDQRLGELPAFLQQLEMESNGKRRRSDGAPVRVQTAPVVFGEPGTDCQHAFMQALHQGTDVISADFIVAALSDGELAGQHELLLANCLAQSEALMRGKTEDEARAELAAAGLSAAEVERLAPHQTFPGGRPSTTILMERLGPQTLGALIALYEHKVFCQGVLWGINPFDQWGVELGKALAKAIRPEISARGERKPAASRRDSSTNQLLDRINALRSRAE